MYQLIENFINDAKEIDDDIFPFMTLIKIGKKVNLYIILTPIGMIMKQGNLSIQL